VNNFLHRYLAGVSKSDFKKAIGSLSQEDLIEMAQTQIKLARLPNLTNATANTNDESSQISPPLVCTTLYVSNIHPEAKNIQDLKTFVSNLFARTPLTLSKSSSLKLEIETKKAASGSVALSAQEQEKKASLVSYLHLRKIRLKPQRKQTLIDGQTVGDDPASDRYQKQDSRVGFIDVTWEQSLTDQIDPSQALKLKQQVEQLCIQILNRQTFHGKRIKVATERKKESPK
jgi:hypothetical protein